MDEWTPDLCDLNTKELARRIKRLLEPTDDDSEWRGVSYGEIVRDAISLCNEVLEGDDR
jgi:hypothetical protein